MVSKRYCVLDEAGDTAGDKTSCPAPVCCVWLMSSSRKVIPMWALGHVSTFSQTDKNLRVEIHSGWMEAQSPRTVGAQGRPYTGHSPAAASSRHWPPP